MRKIATISAFTLLYSSIAIGQTKPLQQPRDVVTAGEVVAISRKMILPNWESTAKAVPRYLAEKCFPTALEAANQLEYFYKILEIAKTKVPANDPIATGQPARKAEVEKARAMVNAAPRLNDGCPDRPVK